MNRFTNKVVLITGGGGGIGGATCQYMAKEGATVVCLDLRKRRAELVAEIINNKGWEAISFQHDASLEDDWEKIVAEIVQKYGKIDILVNNAYRAYGGRISELTYSQWESNFDVNLDAAFLGIKMVHPHMSSGSAIVNIGSIVAHLGMPKNVGYGAAKGALLSLTKAAAADFAAENIRVNLIAPGFVQTKALDGLADLLSTDGKKDILQEILADIPLGHFADPIDIAKSVAFLSSSEASYITGQELIIDGVYML